MPNILDIWAGEQGYYPLEPYGIHGAFYARLDEPLCTPVPVEDIPGFAETYDRIYKLMRSGRFVYLNGDQQAGEGMIGYIGRFVSVYKAFFLSHQSSGVDYLAIPLAGSSVPALPQDQPAVDSQLVVYKGSGKAEPIVGFVQWVLTDREGYDLVNYGAAGTDYRLDGGRLEFLNGGKALTQEDWNDTLASKAFCFLRRDFIQDAMMERIPVYAPGNYETVTAGMKPAEQPIWSILKLRSNDCYKLFADIRDENQTIIGDRYQYLGGIVPGGDGNARYNNGADCRALLKGKAEETKGLVKAYHDRIRQLMEEQGK
jgi:hypothetical protein